MVSGPPVEACYKLPVTLKHSESCLFLFMIAKTSRIRNNPVPNMDPNPRIRFRIRIHPNCS
jgi:hypothetical protein